MARATDRVDWPRNKNNWLFTLEHNMKLVTAIIKPFKLDDVREALSEIGVQGVPHTGHALRACAVRMKPSKVVAASPAQDVLVDVPMRVEDYFAPSSPEGRWRGWLWLSRRIGHGVVCGDGRRHDTPSPV